MVAAHEPLPVSGQETQERGDAARNRELLLAAARKLIAERGPDAVTMDDIAAEAGVGKGTLFRRFGNRARVMLVLLDEDEQALQRAFLFGHPPLGPGAPPLDRLLAYGRARPREGCLGSSRRGLCRPGQDSRSESPAFSPAREIPANRVRRRSMSSVSRNQLGCLRGKATASTFQPWSMVRE